MQQEMPDDIQQLWPRSTEQLERAKRSPSPASTFVSLHSAVWDSTHTDSKKTTTMDRIITLVTSKAFNVDPSAWKTFTSPSDPSGWFGYKVIQRRSGLLVSEPLHQTSPTIRGRIHTCDERTCSPIEQRDCPDLLDIAFLLDGSGSIDSTNFEIMKDFVIALIDSLSGILTRFSITQYSGNPSTHYYFDTFPSDSWKKEMKSITQIRGSTYTAKAIKHVANKVFSQTRGSRSSSKKVLIVITDGESNDKVDLNNAANEAESVGIIRYAIGGNARAELETIGSTPPKTHVFSVDNFNALEVIRSTLEDSIFSIEGTQTGGSLKMEMAQEGFSAAYVETGFQMASVGAYDWSGGFQGYSAPGQLTFSQEKQFVDPDSYLGYSMAVANTKDGELTIVGAPRYQHRGVAFAYPRYLDLSEGQKVDPYPWQFQIGEYFGAEIVTMAVVPSQRYSQVVLITAPLHMEGDREGRVYVCTLTASRVECQFDAPVVLRGHAGERGRFGSSIAPLPDLNGDGLNDLAVGAPLENQGQGSVYIFRGDARGTINTRVSQRIPGSEVKPGLKFFGLSISQSSFDHSKDGLPELAVGLKPIVMVEAQVVFNPAQIPPSSIECINPMKISADVCFNMISYSSVKTVQAKINFTLSLDVSRKRAYFTPTVRAQSESFTLSQQRHCLNYEFSIEPCPEDSLNELFNELTFSFDGIPSKDNLRPSLSQQAQTTTYHPLGFKFNCDNLCVDELNLSFNFSGSSAVRVGIDDLLTVTVSITNLGDDSYNSQVILTYPARLSFRKFSTLQGRVECSSLDSENGMSLGRSTCLIYKPIFKSKAKAVFNVSYGIDSNSQLNNKILITANGTSGNAEHSNESVLFQAQEINILNFVRAFNVTVVIKVPVRLGSQFIWQEQEDLQDCSVASCLVFRCNMFMGRDQSRTFTIAANLSSGWIAQIGLQSAKFLLISTATLEYDEAQYIFYSTESKHTAPIRKIITEVEVYQEANFTKEIVGGTIGGLLLLAIITAGLYKAGFFKSQYKQMIEEAGTTGEGGDEAGLGGGQTGGEAP
ncbi:hypothetical protein CRUP_029970 [Coryphaenoides rupestris]|nr:hypothetical protein CRUP_029970 [Coryphaenoides rupestris]